MFLLFFLFFLGFSNVFAVVRLHTLRKNMKIQALVKFYMFLTQKIECKKALSGLSIIRSNKTQGNIARAKK